MAQEYFRYTGGGPLFSAVCQVCHLLPCIIDHRKVSMVTACVKVLYKNRKINSSGPRPCDGKTNKQTNNVVVALQVLLQNITKYVILLTLLLMLVIYSF